MEKLPKDSSAPDNVTPIERGYKIKFEKSRNTVSRVVEQRAGFYRRLAEARDKWCELLDKEMSLPKLVRDTKYLDQLKNSLTEVEEGLSNLDAWFEKARIVEEAFARKVGAMAEAEKIAMDIEKIKKESREKNDDVG